MEQASQSQSEIPPVVRQELETVTIRFAGDSGDGIQLTGNQFTHTSAIVGNDINTFPDFPAEIRAPAGTLPGVSGFQLSFSSHAIRTPGDVVDAMVVMNPAALKVNIKDLQQGGILIVNEDNFSANDLKKAAYETNPLETGELDGYRVIKIPITSLTLKVVEESGLSRKHAGRCKNMYALGIAFWLYDRPLDYTIEWLNQKFSDKPEIAKANEMALKGGYNYALTIELLGDYYKVLPAELPPGRYRQITGNEALALGAVAASVQAKRPLLFSSYPITPSSDILHELAKYKNFGVKTFQAEDEIAAMSATVGAAFGGHLGLTSTSGPGMNLKGEAIGLGIMVELPMVIINVQRGGPSTGLPTKTEQSDLLSVIYGRHGESPLPVIAPATPSDCFHIIIEAFRIALKYMTPVVVLSDGYLASGAEPWLIPDVGALPDIEPDFWTDPSDTSPYTRDPVTLARHWAIPGTPGLEHRLGGIEKDYDTGNVNYDPLNHQKMTDTRDAKIRGIAKDIPLVEIEGKEQGKVLVISWGSTYGAVSSAVESLQTEGVSVSMVHLRHLFPFPQNLRDIIRQFDKVLIPELNLGQLCTQIRAEFLIDAVPCSKVQGKPFLISEIRNFILKYL